MKKVGERVMENTSLFIIALLIVNAAGLYTPSLNAQQIWTAILILYFILFVERDSELRRMRWRREARERKERG